MKRVLAVIEKSQLQQIGLLELEVILCGICWDTQERSALPIFC
jgi:hypothetical protein